MTVQHYAKTHIQAQFEVPLELSGVRIDQVLVKLLPDYSRERLKEWLVDGQITIDGVCWKPKIKVIGGEKIRVDAEIEPLVDWSPEAIDLDIVHEDEHIIVVNKPAGLVVHPGFGNSSGTLVNALLARYPELEKIPRAGLVHRLDKETSGLLAVARSIKAHMVLVNQLKDRSMSRQYQALVFGHPKREGTIDASIGRHKVKRTKMAITTQGKQAVTHYKVLETTAHCSWVQVKLESGRTHQIRVHMMHIGHPLVGDLVYCQGRPSLNKASAIAQEVLGNFARQALHAERLGLVHPDSGELLWYEADLPCDLLKLKIALKTYDI